jgi:hypothetical protein
VQIKCLTAYIKYGSVALRAHSVRKLEAMATRTPQASHNSYFDSAAPDVFLFGSP